VVERFQVSLSDQGRRLDQFLADHAVGLSRTRARKIIDIGGVQVDGKRARQAGLSLEPGQRIELYQDGGSLDPYRIAPAQIVFQDAYIIVIDKPSGVETQPTPARYRGTLYEALQVLLERDKRFGRKLEIGMVQRLDRDTSGLIVFSIHPRAHKGLSAQMLSRSLTKVYQALVSGTPDPAAGMIRSRLLRERRTGMMKSVARGGREAITAYRVLQTRTGPIDVSLVEVELVTGRTHQIRAHLSEAGHPLLGDRRYGGVLELRGCRFTRHLLHSARLKLVHPVSGRPLEFTAPLPTDMDIERFNRR
jgi:23S rRNA pseudouridine1911/1915/1917 synthase